MIDPRLVAVIALFLAGIGASEILRHTSESSAVDACGVMRGYTTVVAKDDGDTICIYRQNTYPFKTLSGRLV